MSDSPEKDISKYLKSCIENVDKGKLLKLSMQRIVFAAKGEKDAKEKNELAYEFYKKYLWKELNANGEQQSGLILRNIFCQFGNWCVKKIYMIGDDKETKLFWFKQIISFLCYEDPCVAVLEGHTNTVWSVAKLNETTIISGSSDKTVRVWDLNIDRENKIKREQAN